MIEKTGSKVYGLSFPTRKTADSEKQRIESVFSVDDSDEDKTEVEQLKLKLPVPQTNRIQQAKIHRKTKSDYEKALEEDPSVFQYDEIYDDIKSEKERHVDSLLGKKEKQSKYVSRLLKTATERKLERELCQERKAQKEIEAEADLYGDKESFVTSAYKSKLTELRDLVAKREAERCIEERMDITTQDGLGGFYRYMYDHETGRSKPSSTSDQKMEPNLEDRPNAVSKSSEKADDKSNVPTDAPCTQRPSTSHREPRNQRPHQDEKHRDHSRSSNHQSRSRSPESLKSTHSRHLSSPQTNKEDNSKATHSVETKRWDSTSHRESRNEKPRHAEKRDYSRSSNHQSRSRSPESLKSTHFRHLSSPQTNKEDTSKATHSVDTKSVDPAKPSSLRQDPNFIYARPRATTAEQIEEAKQRYLQRKAEGIHAVIAESDSDAE